MSQPDLVLFHFPAACSSVTVCALEMAGLPYRLELVDISRGRQADPAYAAVSPLGKVPAMLVDGEPMTENAALLTFIDALRPEAGVLPGSTPRERAEAVGGLSFCGGNLHSQIRGLVNPQRVTSGDGAGVRARSTELAAKSFAHADRRLAANGWWLGRMSIVDVYLDWAFSVARRGGFDATSYPYVSALAGKLTDVPAYRRMNEIDARARAELKL